MSGLKLREHRSVLRKAGLLKPLCRLQIHISQDDLRKCKARKPTLHALPAWLRANVRDIAETPQPIIPGPRDRSGAGGWLGRQDFVEWIDFCHLCTRETRYQLTMVGFFRGLAMESSALGLLTCQLFAWFKTGSIAGLEEAPRQKYW